MATARRRTAGPRKPMTEREMHRLMEKRQERIFGVVNELHIAGFCNVLVQSTSVGNEDYYCRIFIDEREFGSDRMQTLIDLVSELDGCSLFLGHDLRDEKTRLGVWVMQ